MKTKSVRISGVQVLHPFLPDVGQHDGVADELDHGLERVHEPGRDEAVLLQIARGRSSVTTTNTIAATSHSIRTCLVTEKSMPAIVGRWISG